MVLFRAIEMPMQKLCVKYASMTFVRVFFGQGVMLVLEHGM